MRNLRGIYEITSISLILIVILFRLESDTDNNDQEEQYEAPAGLILPEATKSLAAQV